MKLHLPKTLLTAVLAAVMAPAVWAVSDDTDYSGWDAILNNSGQTAKDSYGIGDAVITSISTADSAATGTTLFLRSNAGLSTATVNTLTIDSGDTLKIDGWHNENNTHPEFSLLTLGAVNFGSNSKLYIESANTAQVNSYSGTFEGEINGTLKLNLGKDSETETETGTETGTETETNTNRIISFTKGTNGLTGAGTIQVMDGTTLKMKGEASGTASVAGTIQVDGGAVLQLDGGDALGYKGNATDAIILQGSAVENGDAKIATLQMLGENVTGNGRQTLTTAITMKGNALITGGSLESFGTIAGGSGSDTHLLTVTGTNNTIESIVYVRSDMKVDVINADDTLTISGMINWRDDNKGAFTKSGAGTLTIAGSGNVFHKKFTQSGGETIIEGTTTFNEGVEIAANSSLTFKKNFSGTSAGNAILGATGTGTINLYTDTTMETAGTDGFVTSAFAGVVSVNSGTLSLGQSGTGYTNHKKIKADSMSIKLNGGNLYYFGDASTLGNLNVADNATYTFHASEDLLVTHKELSIASGKTLTLKSNWGSKVEFEALTADGNLSIVDGTDYKRLNMSVAKVNKVGNIEINSNASTLTLESVTTTGNVLVQKGKINLGAASDGGTIGQVTAVDGAIDITSGNFTATYVDISKGNSSTKNAIVTLKENTKVNVTENIWINNKSSILLEKGASLTKGVINIAGVDSTAEKQGKLHFTGTFVTNGSKDKYDITKEDFTISNANVTIASEGENDVTLGNKLVNSSLINDGGESKTSTGKVTATQVSSLVDVKALTGSIELMNLTAGAELQDLQVGANQNVGAYTGADTTAQKASLSVGGTATFGEGASVSANLKIAANATLVIAGTEGVNLQGNALTLGSGIIMDGALKLNIQRLNYGDTLVLFTGVNALTLPENANPIASLADGDNGSPVQADASTVFSELAANVYTITLDNSIVSINMLAVPEPTTATLSLLALAGLAARRRRK